MGSGEQSDNVKTLTRIINNKVEAIEFSVAHDSRLINKPIQELSLRKNILLGSITRGDKVIIPNGSDILCPDDRVVIITATERLSKLDDILD